MSEHSTLEQRLGSLRSRVLTIAVVGAVIWGVIAGSGLIVSAAWLDLVWELSASLRIFALVAGGLALLCVALYLLRAGSLRSRPDSLARRMDAVAGSEGQILSGWDLGTPGSVKKKKDTDSEVTRGLREMAVRKAAHLAKDVDLAQAAPLRPLRAPFSALATMALAGLLVVLLLPDLARTQWRRFTRPHDEVAPFSLTQFEVSPGDTEVVYGAGLEIHAATSGPPVDEVELVIETADGEESLPMFPESTDRWRASLASLTQPSKYFVRARGARSRRYQINVLTVPRLTEVRVRITPPEYTGQSPYQGAVPQDGIAGLRGTRVQLWAQSNRPLSAGSLKLFVDQRQDVTMHPARGGDSEVTGEFTIQSAGRLELTVTDVDGQSSQEKFTAMITLLEDQRPFVRVLEPKPMSLATPSATLPVVLSGEDDYGLSKIELFRNLNDSRPMPTDVPLPQPQLRRAMETVPLQLGEYGLQPGDVIKLFARVEDNDPQGAKGFESAISVIQIISQEEFERMTRARRNLQMLMSRYRMAARHLQKVREENERLQRKTKDKPQEQVSEQLRKEMEQMTNQLAKDLAALREMSKNPLPYDLDQNFSRHLERLTRNLEQAREKLQKLQRQENLTNEELDQALESLLGELAQADLDFEQQAMQPLEKFEKLFPLIADQSRFVQLYQRQRELAERLASLKGQDGQDDPAAKVRMRELEAEQSRIRQALDELLGDIESHATVLPDDVEVEEDKDLAELRASALKFVDDVRASGALEAMNEAETALAGFEGTRAHAKATEAADILEKFIEKSQSMGGAAAGACRFQPSLGEGLGQTIGQMLADMGLGEGMGQGDGSGGGYSARSNSLRNMGLYGQTPSQGDSAGSQLGEHSAQGDGRLRSGSHNTDDPANLVESQSAQGTGAGQTSVPTRYRRRVGWYFERIAEEIGQR